MWHKEETQVASKTHKGTKKHHETLQIVISHLLKTTNKLNKTPRSSDEHLFIKIHRPSDSEHSSAIIGYKNRVPCSSAIIEKLSANQLAHNTIKMVSIMIENIINNAREWREGS